MNGSDYMKYIGHPMCEKTVRRILNSYGIYLRNDDRKHSWNVFFESHKEVMAACDFATYELATENGLQREHILFFENVATREVWCGGIAHEPDSDWMAQVARNLEALTIVSFSSRREIKVRTLVQ